MNLKPAHPRPKSHGSDLAANPTASRSQIAKRRSNRMALHAAVGLAGENRQKCSFTMPDKATKLNNTALPSNSVVSYWWARWSA